MRYLDNENPVPFTNAFLVTMDELMLDTETLVCELLLFMGEAKVAEFARTYEYDNFFENLDKNYEETA